MDQRKKHYVTLQLGPVNMQKNERAVVLGLITTMLNGVLDNARHPREASNFIEYFLRERLERADIKLLEQLEVIQRNKITIALENRADNTVAISGMIAKLNKMRGFDA